MIETCWKHINNGRNHLSTGSFATIHNIMDTITQYLNGVYVGSIVCMKLYIIVYIISYQYHNMSLHSGWCCSLCVFGQCTCPKPPNRGHRVCLKIGYPYIGSSPCSLSNLPFKNISHVQSHPNHTINIYKPGIMSPIFPNIILYNQWFFPRYPLLS